MGCIRVRTRARARESKMDSKLAMQRLTAILDVVELAKNAPRPLTPPNQIAQPVFMVILREEDVDAIRLAVEILNEVRTIV
jgi:hypothetical protein